MLGKALLSFSILGWSKICSVASYMDGLKGIDIAISRSRYKWAIENACAFIVSLASQLSHKYQSYQIQYVIFLTWPGTAFSYVDSL